MNKRRKIILIGIILLILAVLIVHLVYVNYSTSVPTGTAVLHCEGKSFPLTWKESEQMRKIFDFKFYNPGIGGCYYEEDIAISFGDRVFAIALDGCWTAKEWDAERCIEFNRLEFELIAALFKKYCEDAPVNIFCP